MKTLKLSDLIQEEKKQFDNENLRLRKEEQERQDKIQAEKKRKEIAEYKRRKRQLFKRILLLFTFIAMIILFLTNTDYELKYKIGNWDWDNSITNFVFFPLSLSFLFQIIFYFDESKILKFLLLLCSVGITSSLIYSSMHNNGGLITGLFCPLLALLFIGLTIAALINLFKD